MLNRTTKTRLHIRSINETSSKADEELAELFREMRQATGLSQGEIAGQLKTTVETIGALEQGHLSTLPPWTDSRRIIVEYTGMLGLDSEPVLRRVMVQLPGDHPKRPKTQIHEPSYDNMQSNVSAVMNRVPGTQEPLENSSLTQQPEQIGNPSPNPNFAPGYGDMRAIPARHQSGMTNSQVRPVAIKRKSGVFVPLMQFLLLLIILGAGYAMWLTVNDPQRFEELKTLAITSWDIVREQFRILTGF